jgi:argininosuccinate synthase
MMQRKKIVLAYSGGLDTSVAVKWLSKKGFDVICYMADVGQKSDFSIYRKRALKTGAKKVVVEDLKKEFAEEFVLRALKAQAIYEKAYPLCTALSRPAIAKGLVRTAKKEKAGYVAHGCTGKGNDQVRFEFAVNCLNPKLKVIAPVREWGLKTREQEMEYASANSIPIDITKKKPYSLDVNLWGISIESGKLEDPYYEPDEDIYQITKSPAGSLAKPVYVNIEFKKGKPVKLNGKKQDIVGLIGRLAKIAGDAGVGRTDMVENRLVGIKSREIYEAPAAWTLYKAHSALESLALDRELLHFKEAVSLKYADLIYYGLWFTPLKRALDKFVDYSQEKVNGTVRVKLHKGNCIIAGRKSPDSLYRKELATYGRGDKFDQSLAKGFIELWGLPYRR